MEGNPPTLTLTDCKNSGQVTHGTSSGAKYLRNGELKLKRPHTHSWTYTANGNHRSGPHGEMSGRNTWSKEFPTSSFLRQKRPQTLVPQRLEGILSLGKDEVGGSNRPSSFKKHLKSSDFGRFLL